MTTKKEENEIAYSFFKYKETDEIHIFKGKFNPDGGCSALFKCICQKIEDWRADDVTKVEACLNEDDARQFAADKGRPVCGTCVSDLYETYS